MGNTAANCGCANDGESASVSEKGLDNANPSCMIINLLLLLTFSSSIFLVFKLSKIQKRSSFQKQILEQDTKIISFIIVGKI